ncbi:MAG: tetratricopeptide repeat protein [Calditrichaeota bacterium]|nr:tetratricopeptide repeat protein [Calditrichota bacterium]MCB9391157.1 tetratricopeptide repeat protein [Calditrichota bacterium]
MRILVLFLFASVALGGLPSRDVKKGNQAAQEKRLDDAQYYYVRALEDGADTANVMYNLGNAMYDAGEFERAQRIYGAALDSTESTEVLSQTLYNMGTASLQAQKLDEAVSALTESLVMNPADEDAKRNLELARRLQRMQQEQQQQQQQQGEQDSTKQNQDQQQQQQSEQNQPPEDQQQEQQQSEPQQSEQQGDSVQQQPQTPQQMTKEEAEQLLNALQQEEQKTLQEVRKAKVAGKKKKERDW